MADERYDTLVREIAEMGLDSRVIKFVGDKLIRDGRTLTADLLVNGALDLTDEEQKHIMEGWFCCHSKDPTPCEACNKAASGGPLHAGIRAHPIPPRFALMRKRHPAPPVSPPPPRPHSASPPVAAAAAAAATTPTVKEEDACVICFANAQNSVFVPCGHIATCFECGDKYFKEKGVCPICAKKVDMIIRTYKASI